MSQQQTASLNIITARKRSLRQGNIFAPVCHSAHRRGGSTSVHAGKPPLEGTPLWEAHTPSPQEANPPGSTPPKEVHTPREAQPPLGSTPPGMQSCFLYNLLASTIFI